MTRQNKAGIILVSIGMGLTASGCAVVATPAGSAAIGAAELQDRVMINDHAVQIISQRSALDLMDGRVARRFLQQGTSLVVVDDVPLIQGIESLRVLSARDVQSITTLWPVAAAFRYGSAGADGAIVITTRRGHAGSRSN